MSDAPPIGREARTIGPMSLVGTLLGGRYRLDAEIGRGGMSTVYRAFDTVLERRVAIKLIDAEGPPLRAVVMAGGLGSRLGELTVDTPKPMLPVGDRPLLERIIEQLREAGIRHVNLTTHYRADVIASHFGDGSEHGVEIEYVSEERPLGTAGALVYRGCHE